MENNEIQLDWRWSTHQPLNELILSVFNPQLIVELGGGIYSTPLFIESNPDKFICIENDKDWFDKLCVSLDVSSQWEIRLHDLGPGIDKGIFKHELNKQKQKQIKTYYKALGVEVDKVQAKTKFLFVDNFTCCRSIALNTLARNFDILAYHDCQPAGIPWYDYNFDLYFVNNFNHYYLITPDSWTGVFINKNQKYNEGELKKESIYFAQQYAQKNELDPEKVYFQKTELV